MRILRASGHTSMPWKNGGGRTIEIAKHPAGANLDEFAWRVSLAKVDVAGPFSRFPGIDRTIALVEGAGMTLAIAGRVDVRLDARSEPFAFPGEADVSATIEGGTVLDFNAMTRRGLWSHAVMRVMVDAPKRIAALSESSLAFVVRGSLEGDASLGRHDALVLEKGEHATLRSPPETAAELLVVDLWES